MSYSVVSLVVSPENVEYRYLWVFWGKREFDDETSIEFNYVYLMSIERKSKENLT